jgi:hypothetical protein
VSKHCRGCRHHHNAGHPKNSPLAAKFNDWCCKFGCTAEKALSRCKLWNAKEEVKP